MDEARCVAAIMAHPDDIEFQCAGTLCRLRDLGWRVAMATMTAGDCGSVTVGPDEISRIRRAEAAASAALLDAEYHCFGELDLLLFLGPQTVRDVVEYLRRVRPDLVITHSPVDYMIDHEQTSAIVRAATFGAPIPNFRTGAAPAAPPLERIPHLYYADPLEGRDILGTPVAAGLHVDISGVIDRKERMLACHASQREWLFSHHGIDEYILSMRAWGEARGREAGVAYAEGFRQHRGHAYPQDDLLAALLTP